MLKKALFIALVCCSFIVQAQVTAIKPSPLNETSVVRGEDGLVYPYAVWKKLLSTGKYSIKGRGTKTESDQPEYLIYELTAAQKASMMERMPKPRASEAFAEGTKFDGFKVTDLNGNKFDLRNATGKVTVLNFWFVNCAPCKTEIPDLNALATAYKENKEVIFLAIALDDRYDIKSFLKTTPFDYNIIDGGRYLADKYGVKSYPTHVVIDKSGIIRFSTLGLAPNTISWVKKSIDESLSVK